VDDDACVDDQDDKLYLAEKELREAREEEASRAAAKKAQREQDRLLEEHLAEIAHIKRVEQQRLAAAATSVATIEFDDIVVNEMLFCLPENYDIQEDFTEFEFDEEEEEERAVRREEGGEVKEGEVKVDEKLFGGDDDDVDLEGLEDN
jgi:hypothetical protein